MSNRKPGEPPGIRDARREMYRQQILTAAEYEFARAGFTDAKVTAVAATADLSLATLYKSFKSKDEIWNALVAQRMKELVGLALAATDSVESPLERIVVGARAQVEFFAQHPNFLRLNVKENWNWATATEAGRGGQRAAWRTGVDMMTHAAQAAVEAGELTHMRPTVVAGLAISALQVWLTEWINSGTQRSHSHVADELQDYLRRLLVPPSPTSASPPHDQRARDGR